MTQPATGDRRLGRRIRLARGLRSQGEFVRALSRVGKRRYSRPWLSNIEAGRRAIDLDDLRLVARVARVPLADLLDVDSHGPLCDLVRPFEGRLSPEQVDALAALLREWSAES